MTENEHPETIASDSWIERVVTYEINARSIVAPRFLDILAVTDRPLTTREQRLFEILMRGWTDPISHEECYDFLFKIFNFEKWTNAPDSGEERYKQRSNYWTGLLASGPYGLERAKLQVEKAAATEERAVAEATLAAELSAKLAEESRAYETALSSVQVEITVLANQLHEALISRDDDKAITALVTSERVIAANVAVIAQVTAKSNQQQVRTILKLALYEHKDLPWPYRN